MFGVRSALRFTVLLVLLAGLTFSVGGANADLFHGISLTKSCSNTTPVGQSVLCRYLVSNGIDQADDTYTIDSFVDVIQTAGGGVSSLEIIQDLELVVTGGATCTGPAPDFGGTGTIADPYVGATSCSLPADATVVSNPHGFYTATAADYNVAATHRITDTVTLGFIDQCNGGDPGCNEDHQENQAGAGTRIVFTPSVVTSVKGTGTTAIEVGGTAFDTATLSSASPDAGGTVNYKLYTDSTCQTLSAAPALDQNVTVAGGVVPNSSTVTFSSTGKWWFQATYLGDVNNVVPAGGVKSVCTSEPLTVVDANIQITPATATNRVGTNHTLHCHINVNDGTGFANAPADTTCTVNITAGPGTPATQNCQTVGATGTCDVVITSNTTGTSTIQATTSVSVAGVSLTRTTGDAHVGDGPNASKQWVNAAIVIAPNATNEVGQPHTFTVTVLQDTGGGLVAVGAGLPCNITLTNANGAAATPAGPFNLTTNASGQCAVTFTSPTGGTVTGHASSTVTIGGVVMNVETNGTAPNSSDAVKTFVDANIQITPATAINPVGTNHTLHCHINVNNGGGGFANAPAGTTCTVNITAGPGTPATQNCLTVLATGTCDVVITSAVGGTSTIRATTTVSVGGVSLTRTTGDAHVGDGPNAEKLWADDVVATQVKNAANQDITGTTVAGGTVVHDTATVTKTAATPASVPAPTGTVSFTLFDTLGCTGNVVATDPNKPLVAGEASSVTFTTPAATGSFSYLAHYNGDANYPAHDALCEPFSVQGNAGQIAPTQVSCQDFISGTAPTLGQVNYSVDGGKIGQGINPGVFFFYTRITTTVPNQVVTVTQTNTSTNNAAPFLVHNGQARLYTANCSSWRTGTPTAGGGATFTVATPGNYVISLKYDSKSIAGTTAPVPANIRYDFATSLGGSTGASVLLVKQP